MSQATQLRRQLNNARRRAAYWSGAVSWGFDPITTRKQAALEYQSAVVEVEDLRNRLTKLTGKRPAKLRQKASKKTAETPLFSAESGLNVDKNGLCTQNPNK